MCDKKPRDVNLGTGKKTIPVSQAVGMVLAHDITEIRKDEFKGCAFKKGHVIRPEDIEHLQRLGKEHLYALDIGKDEMHEDDAAQALAHALMGDGVSIQGEPKEGKVSLIAERDGLLKIDKEALLKFNMLGDVMCATLHDNTVVKKGQPVAGTKVIPLVIRSSVIEEAVAIARQSPEMRNARYTIQKNNAHASGIENHESLSPSCRGVIQVREMRRPRAGVVITGNEVYYGKIKDTFAPVIAKKIAQVNGQIVGIYFAPDNEKMIEDRIHDLLNMGADLLIMTGGMSVDPDDVTRFAIRNAGAEDIAYGSAVLPGAMFLIAYIYRDQESIDKTQGKGLPDFSSMTLDPVPVLGIPACGMYAKTTIFDLLLPRVLAGERLGRKELAALGHGGMCLKCDSCRYPVCPFGKLG